MVASEKTKRKRNKCRRLPEALLACEGEVLRLTGGRRALCRSLLVDMRDAGHHIFAAFFCFFGKAMYQ